MKTFLMSWGMLVLSVLFNVFGVFVIKLKMNEYGEVKMDSLKTVLYYFLVLLKSPVVVCGVILFCVAPFLFAIALSRMELAVAYPAQIGLNFVILILLGFWVLGEPMTAYKMIGIVLTLVAIYFFSKG